VTGGAKKFLYTGAKKEKEPEDEWSFAPKQPAQMGKHVVFNWIQ
jgi:hypothetical protein